VEEEVFRNVSLSENSRSACVFLKVPAKTPSFIIKVQNCPKKKVVSRRKNKERERV